MTTVETRRPSAKNPIDVSPIEGEVWLPIPGYEGIYVVSDHGRVKRATGGTGTRAGRVLNPHVTKLGYRTVRLSLGGKSKAYLIHRLVASAFISRGEYEGVYVRHLDDNPSNNCVSNLAWGDQTDNMADMRRNGNAYWDSRTHCKNGHEYNEVNTTKRSDGNGRLCLPCHRKVSLDYLRRKREDKN